MITMVSCSAILSTVGCKSQSTLERTIHDTLRIEKTVTLRDTVFKTDSAAVRTALSVPCPDFKTDFKPVSKTVKNAKLTTELVSDSLVINCKCDTLAIVAQIRDTKEKQYHSRSEKETKKAKPEKYIPGYVQFLAWSGGVFWVLLLLGIYYKHFKKTKP